jgi:hypothetical protein
MIQPEHMEPAPAYFHEHSWSCHPAVLRFH